MANGQTQQPAQAGQQQKVTAQSVGTVNVQTLLQLLQWAIQNAPAIAAAVMNLLNALHIPVAQGAAPGQAGHGGEKEQCRCAFELIAAVAEHGCGCCDKMP